MSGPDLIDDYVSALAALLPADVVEELADGLDSTRQRLVSEGLDAQAASVAAVAEFGRPEQVARAFVQASTARRAARRLLVLGPVVGSCWAVVLLSGRAWTWPVPGAVRWGAGVVLLTAIAALATAAAGRAYRRVQVLAVVGCCGVAGLDIALLTAGAIAASLTTVTVPLAVAVCASTIRLAVIIRLWPSTPLRGT